MSSYLTLSAWKVEHFLLLVMSFHWVSWLSRSAGCFYFCLVCLFCFCLAGCSGFFLSTKWGTLHRLQFLDFSSSRLTLYLGDLVQCNAFKYHPMLQIPNSYFLLSFLLWTFDSSQQFTVHLIVQSIQSSTATSDLFPLSLFFPMSVHGTLAVVQAQITGVIFSPVFFLQSTNKSFKVYPLSIQNIFRVQLLLTTFPTANFDLSQYYLSLWLFKNELMGQLTSILDH